jgi:hypothetical protein
MKYLRGWASKCSIVVAAAFALAAVGSATAGATTTFYCNIEVSGYTECPYHWNIDNVTEDWNQAYAQQHNGWPVCERATIQYHAQNSSFRCGSSPVDSNCDLVGYQPGTVFSMYTDNNGVAPMLMVGKAFGEITGCV